MSASGFKLYGYNAGGSTAIEIALQLAGQDYEFIKVARWDPGPRWEELLTLNPLGQIPVLVFPDGEVMTESAAILIALTEAFPDANLAPKPGDPLRRNFLRHMVYVPANIYAMYGLRDTPENWVDDDAARAQLKQNATDRIKFLWTCYETHASDGPFILGNEMSLLDVYIAVVSRWRPGRDWFAKACPKLALAARNAEQHPVVSATIARNFGA